MGGAYGLGNSSRDCQVGHDDCFQTGREIRIARRREMPEQEQTLFDPSNRLATASQRRGWPLGTGVGVFFIFIRWNENLIDKFHFRLLDVQSVCSLMPRAVDRFCF
jgi:hypothetical protein